MISKKADRKIVDDGFSSEQQFEEELIYQRSPQQVMEINRIKNQAKLSISPPQQIRKTAYSLHPDIITGWAPRIDLPEPIPLKFEHSHIDRLINYVLKHNHQFPEIKLCYFGPRYATTYFSWYQKQFDFPYKHITTNTWKFTNRFFCGQHWDAQSSNHLQFDSLYQSSNLDSAFKIGEFQYQLFMRVDSNTRGHLQWYNFKVQNMQKGKSYKFHISNFQKGGILYTRGMRPYIYSEKRFKSNGVEWQQQGINVKYDKKMPRIMKRCKYEQEIKYYILSFEYQCKYDEDIVHFAYCIPYSYSKMKQLVLTMEQQLKDQDIFHVEKLCKSLGGLEIPLLTITKDASYYIQARKESRKVHNKKVILVSARTHPGETNGSFVMQGFLKWLCGQDKMAQFLRETVIFRIVPMLNVDGVAIGNYRTSLAGYDLNRQFINPDKSVFPEVYNLKRLVKQQKQIYQNHLNFFLDFHGHSVKKNVFVYGPEFPIIQKNYYECRVLPKLISRKTEMFRYYSCSFKVSQTKQSTARAVIFKNYGIPFTYTFEASKSSFYDRDHLKDIPFDAQKWIQMGEKICQSIAQYLQFVNEEQQELRQRRKQRKQAIQNRHKIKAKKYLKMRRSNKYFMKTSAQFNFNCANEKPFESSGLIRNEINDRFKGLLDQIKQEQECIQKNFKQSQIVQDDLISQGSSDCQPQQDNLQQGDRKALIKAIKQKSQNLFSPSKIRQRKYQSQSCQINKLQSKLIIEGQDKKQISSYSRPSSSQKRDQKRIDSLKKKNSLNSSLSNSPAKKEDRSNSAKIVNFSFGLTPVARQKPQKQTIQRQVTKFLPQFNPLSTNQVAQQQKKLKIGCRNYDYSQTFRKTFLSISKQIARRQKRINTQGDSQSANTNLVKINDLRGKRIRFNQ